MDEQVPTVTFFFNGAFTQKPLVYFAYDQRSFDVDLKQLNYEQFLRLARGYMNTICNSVYFCPPDVRLAEGLHSLQNECDYSELVEQTYANQGRNMNVYFDHYDEPLFEWIAMEEPDPEDDMESEDEEGTPILPGGGKLGHEEDDVKVDTSRNVNDHFLNKLCPVKSQASGGHPHPMPMPMPAPVYPRFNENLAWNEMAPELGMRFASPSDLKCCLVNYAVANGYDLWYERNDKDRILARCCRDSDPPCTFRLWASWMQEERTFQIKSFTGEHKCCRQFKLSIVTYKWIGKQFVDGILANPRMSIRQIKSEVSKLFNINVSYGQCRNAKRYALGEIEGTLQEHYAKLWDYGAEILRANPGSHVEIGAEPQPDNTAVFEKFYVSFKGVVDGWKAGCRKVVCLDGCFLKGVCKGELLSAVGRDGNNHIYPIAWAVVNVENKNYWKWFLDNLIEDIGDGGNGHGITILSDGHKGLAEAVKERLPGVEHRLCSRHILANFHSKFKGEAYLKPFWAALNATTIPKDGSGCSEDKPVTLEE